MPGLEGGALGGPGELCMLGGGGPAPIGKEGGAPDPIIKAISGIPGGPGGLTGGPPPIGKGGGPPPAAALTARLPGGPALGGGGVDAEDAAAGVAPPLRLTHFLVSSSK